MTLSDIRQEAQRAVKARFSASICARNNIQPFKRENQTAKRAVSGNSKGNECHEQDVARGRLECTGDRWRSLVMQMAAWGLMMTKRAIIWPPDGGDAVRAVAEALAWTPPYCVIDIHGTKDSW